MGAAHGPAAFRIEYARRTSAEAGGNHPATSRVDGVAGRIAFRFHARDLHLIMGPAARRGAVSFRVLIDGQPPGASHGTDVDDQGNRTITEQRLYQLIRQSGPIADRQFEIEFLDSGVEAYAFTFG
jgi:hypothetical protein